MGKQDRVDPYVEGDSWRCPVAPINPKCPAQVKYNTGAHHWVNKWFGYKVEFAFVCRHCYDVRKFPTTLYNGFKGRVEEVNLEDIEDGS